MRDSATSPCASERPLARVLLDRGTVILFTWALLLRIVLLVGLWSRDPTLASLHSDPAYYDEWARAMAAGQEFLPGRPHWLPPLYPWFLSVLYRWTGGALLPTLAVQGLLGLLTTALLVLLAERVAGRRAGLAAGWLWTLYLPACFFETRLLAVNLATPLAVGALLAVVAAERELAQGRHGRQSAALGGLFAGLAALVRPNLLLGLPLLALALLLRGRRAALPAALALLGCGALGVAPGLATNLARSGQPVLVSANGGVNFWFGNNPDARGTFHAPGPEWGSIDHQRDESVGRASAELDRPVDEREASAFWFDEGWRWLREHPGDAAQLWGRKAMGLLSSQELGIQYVPAANREVVPLLWLAPLPFGALLALACVGLPGAARGRGALIAWLLAGLAATLLYFTYSRFRLPLLPALLPFAGRGVVRGLDCARGLARLPVVATLAGLPLLALSFVDAERGYLDHLRANAFADMGAAAADPTQARALFTRSLEAVEGSPKARLGLGRLALARGDHATAIAELEAGLTGGLPLPELEYALAGALLTAPSPPLRDPARAVVILRAGRAALPDRGPQACAFGALLVSALIDFPGERLDPGEPGRLLEQLEASCPDDPSVPLLRQRLGD